MTTPQQRQKRIEEIKKLIEELSIIDPRSLARKDELSRDINFEEAVPDFEVMLDIVKQISQRDIMRLSYDDLNGIQSALNVLSNLVREVRAFALNQNTPADVCKNIINRIKNSYDDFMKPLTIPLAFTATQSTDYAKIEREAKGYHATMKEESDKLQQFIKKCNTDAEKALRAVQEQAAQAGVSTNAQIFLMNSSDHAKIAKNWLVTTIVISFLTLLVAIIFLFVSFSYTPSSTAKAIQYIVSKIIVLSTLSFGIFWSVGNYRAQKHNEMLNKHRANALLTFRAFVEGSDDPRIKDTVLLHAAQAAFTCRSTGYDMPDKEIQNINPVVEVLGKVIDKSGNVKA